MVNYNGSLIYRLLTHPFYFVYLNIWYDKIKQVVNVLSKFLSYKINYIHEKAFFRSHNEAKFPSFRFKLLLLKKCLLTYTNIKAMTIKNLCWIWFIQP